MQSLRGLAHTLLLSTLVQIAAAGSSVAAEPALAWQTYHSDAGGYGVSTPSDWLIDERTTLDANVITTLSSPDGQLGFTIVAHPSRLGAATSDLPATRCEPITVGGLAAERCFDTTAWPSTIRVVASGRLYEIATDESPAGATMSQTLLASLTFDQADPALPGLQNQPAAVPYVGCGGLATGQGKVRPLCPPP